MSIVQDVEGQIPGKRKIDMSRYWRPIALATSLTTVIFFLIAIILTIHVVMNSTKSKPSTNENIIIDDSNDDHPFREKVDESKLPEDNLPMSRLPWPQPSPSMYTSFKKASIATDHGYCSEIGRNVLLDGGNAVEATIASLLCIGVVNPQSSGLGGGFLMTVYNKTTGRCVTIDARETAPASAFETMYLKNKTESSYGYTSSGIPSELHGFFTAFTRFGSGNVTWKRLVTPSIKLADNGFPVSNNLAEILQTKSNFILNDDELRKEFVDVETGQVYEEGDRLRRPNLAKTLQRIADEEDPIQLFYKGDIAETIGEEFAENGGYVTAEDLANYETVIEENPLMVDGLPGGFSMCGPPPPSSFVVLQSIVRTVANFYNGSVPIDLDSSLLYHRIIEAQKFGYAQRSKLGDVRFVESAKSLVEEMITPEFISRIVSSITDRSLPMEDYVDVPRDTQEDHGTSHVSTIDADGNAVSCTSTINAHFGSMKISPTLGIIWNDEMDDFSTPGMSNMFGYAPSPTNFISPGNKPMSSMSPTVVFNKETRDVRMVSGAAGGSYIISATAASIIQTVLFNRTVKQAIDAPRLHDQYIPFTCVYESDMPEEIISELRTRHNQTMSRAGKIAAVVQALEVGRDGFIHGNSDFRRKTSAYPSGY